jgi:uncharacterized protein DUF4019
MLLVALQLSCGMKQGKEAGERAAQKFHTQLNAGQFHDIYSQADEAFQKAISEGDATALFDAVRRKLGTVQEAKPTAWFVNANTGGTFVTLGYDVQFSEGKAVEQFVFKVNGDNALLVNYNINSPVLITK